MIIETFIRKSEMGSNDLVNLYQHCGIPSIYTLFDVSASVPDISGTAPVCLSEL